MVIDQLVVVVLEQVLGPVLMVPDQVQVVPKRTKTKLIQNGLRSILNSIEIDFTAM